MLRLHDGQATLWEEMLPEVVRLLSDELASVEALLDDRRFLDPLVRRFSCPIGRPTIPMDTFLRLMYLKHRHCLGYETLVKEIADSLSWRRFCRIRLKGAVPHPTTLLKLARRFSPAIVDDLNSAVVAEAVEHKVLRTRRLRVDTTAAEAAIRYPTDSGLCAHAVSRLTRAVKAIKGARLAVGTLFLSRSRLKATGEAVRNISHTFGRPHARAAVERLTGTLHDRADACARSG